MDKRSSSQFTPPCMMCSLFPPRRPPFPWFSPPRQSHFGVFSGNLLTPRVPLVPLQHRQQHVRRRDGQGMDQQEDEERARNGSSDGMDKRLLPFHKIAAAMTSSTHPRTPPIVSCHCTRTTSDTQTPPRRSPPESTWAFGRGFEAASRTRHQIACFSS